MSSPTPTLEYSSVATQMGVICDLRDEGVTLTFPTTFGTELLDSGTHPLFNVIAAIAWAFQRLIGIPRPPRIVIEVNRTEVRIGHRSTEGSIRTTMHFRTWPREAVAEIRRNRYAKALLVRVPGQDNFDMLTDYPERLIDWVGKTTTDALHRTQPKAEK